MGMSTPRPPKPAKLFVSVIAAFPQRIATVLTELAGRYGTMDFVSVVLPFAYTDYYEAELGRPLLRRFASFLGLIQQDDLPRIKEETNHLELCSSSGGRRSVNIDPGYLLAERFVLATGKNYAHRIYLGRGIYGDLTLLFRDNEYRPLPWTYPDYAEPTVRHWLRSLRQKYLLQLRAEGKIPEDGEEREGGES
jgi:hypothetical protein